MLVEDGHLHLHEVADDREGTNDLQLSTMGEVSTCSAVPDVKVEVEVEGEVLARLTGHLRVQQGDGHLHGHLHLHLRELPDPEARDPTRIAASNDLPARSTGKTSRGPE